MTQNGGPTSPGAGPDLPPLWGRPSGPPDPAATDTVADPFAAPAQRGSGAAGSAWDAPPQTYGTPVPGAAWTSGDGWGAPPLPAPSTNPWAVVALVTGLLALVPVAVPAGVVALVQTSRRRQAGRGLAVGGLVAAAVWTPLLVLLAVGLLAGALGTPLGRVAEAGPATVGTCLLLADGPGGGASPVDCAAPHDAEIYLVEVLGGQTWPGEDEVEHRADEACYQAFGDYVGRSYELSDHDYGYFLPDRAEWAAGEHRAVCVVVPTDGVLLGPVRGSGA